MEFHDYITCPRCGAEDQDRGDYPRALEHDGDSAESECHECGAAFLVTMCVEYTFASTPMAEHALFNAIQEQKAAASAHAHFAEAQGYEDTWPASYWADVRYMHANRAAEWRDRWLREKEAGRG